MNFKQHNKLIKKNNNHKMKIRKAIALQEILELKNNNII